MTVIINGTTGITNVNGSAAAPAETGTDTDTGIVYGTNTLSMATGGTTALTANSAQGIQVLNTIGVGNATPSTSGAGITFPATQSASSDANTLDDYEEGSWTPTITPQSGTLTAYSSTGSYTKVGRSLILQARIVITTAGTSSGIAFIGGVPFSIYSSTAGAQYVGVCREAAYTGTIYGTNFSGTTGVIQTLTNTGIAWTNSYVYDFSITLQTT